ncbi:MAG: tetratricopeptide repeat protein [Nitrospinales bacterium]
MIRNSAAVKAIILAVIVVGVYYPSFHADFIWDDDVFFTRNPLMAGPDALKKFWLSTDAPDYFPLVSTTLWAQRKLWGLNPLGYHLVNIGFHALNGVLFWRALVRLAVPGAWTAALLFAVHPLQVESAAWVTQIKNVQSVFFYLLAVLFYLRWDSRLHPVNYFLSLFLFLLALLSKTSVVMLPVVLLLYHWWKNDRPLRTAVPQTIPFFFLSAALAAVTVWFQYQSAGARGADWSLSFAERLVNAGHAVWFYLFKLLFPVNLTFVYPRWSPDAGDWVSYLPHAGAALLAFLLFKKRRSWGRSAIFGLGYFVIFLFPVMGFFNIYFMRYSFVADHWQYIAGQGIVALSVGGLFAGSEKSSRAAIAKPLVCAAMVLLTASAALLTWNRQAVYQNNVLLWQDTLKKNPRAWIAHNNLGNELELRNNLKQAEEHYRQTLAIKPDYAKAEDNLGLVLLKQGRPEESKVHFQNAIRLEPKLWQAHNNLGTVLAKEGRTQEAARHFETALRYNPASSKAHNNLGLILDRQGRTMEALGHFYKALANPRTRRETHTNIGALLLELGKKKEAIIHLRKALEIDPKFKPALRNLELANRVQS